MSSPDEPHLSHSQLASLSALADGTLDPAHRASVQAWIERDPQLHELYRKERAVVRRLQQARATDRAPAGLRARVDGARAPRPARAGWRPGYAAALATAAAVAVVLGLTLPGGTRAPSISQAAALALRGPAQPAPGPNPKNPGVKLNRDVQEIYFPNWGGSFGWMAVGQRADRLGGRPAVTVYYARGEQQVAYTIVGAGALAEPSGAVTRHGAYRLHTLTSRGRTIVTWRRDDHTCVLSASGVPASVLLRLAAWRPPAIRE